MNPKFLNRAQELAFLGRKWKEGGPQLIVIYGRRRVGKTELLAHFARDKPHIYFLANKRGTLDNVDRFAQKAADTFADTKPEAKDFDDVFRYILRRIGNKKFIIIIDEFSYLIEKDPAIPSTFQLVLDEVLKDSNIMLVVCGSSISMMERGVLSYKSPLYGRRTGQWRVTPFALRDVVKFFPKLNIQRIVELYSIAGNMPAYLAKLDPSKSLWENVKEKILTKGEFLYDEGENVLRQELKEPDTYFSILWAMTKAAKPGEIANLARLAAKDLPKYIKTLQVLDLVERISLVTQRRPKKSLYRIKDNFIKFWFEFVYPNRSELEEGRADHVLDIIKARFEIGELFERFCSALIREGQLELPFQPERIGKEWGRVPGLPKGRDQWEIDIVAVNSRTDEILFAECKWQDRVDARKVLAELKQKANYVNWHRDKRKEYWAIFAKSFKHRIPDVALYDLREISRLLKTK